MKKCPSCEGTIILDYRTGDYICTRCGLIVDKMMVLESTHQQDEDNKKTRTSFTPISQHDKDLGSTIQGFRDIKHKKLSVKERKRAAKLSFIQKRDRASNPKERNLRKGLMEMTKLRNIFQLSQQVLDESAYLLRKYFKKKGIKKGQPSIEQLADVIFYCVMRKNEIPISIKEFDKFIGMRGKVLLKIMGEIRRLGYDAPLLKPQYFLLRYAVLLDLEQQIVNKAREFLENNNFNLQGINPSIVAAASLYYFAKKEKKEMITYEKLNKILDLSSPRMRDIVGKIKKSLGE